MIGLITTVTLNPAVDKILRVRGLRSNRLNRAEVLMTTAGGKGVNVSYLLQAMGSEAIAMGFVGGTSGQFLEEELRKAGITTSFVHIAEETRTNYIVLDEARHTQTQINERGPLVSIEEIQEFEGTFKRVLSRSEMVIIAGSLPQGVEPEICAELITMARERGIKTILNTTEPALIRGLEAQPFLVKPDIRATDQFMGVRLNSNRRRLEVAQRILAKGVQVVVIGSNYINHIVVTPEQIWEASAPGVEIVSRVGVGDAMIGGMAFVLAKGGVIDEAIRLGMAASIAVVRKVENRIESRQEVEQFLDWVQLKEVKR
ncbi:MAG: 1-phosphofructokinase family hexose kinase [Actinomycetota bacterium]|nr:1-phosphofructokinase family hexose kinase [Actinomycetota bacterium]